MAFLRGINVGGRSVIRMKDLAAVFERASAGDVRTYIQSGNVVFSCGAKQVDSVVARAKSAIRDECGVETSVIIRTGPELESVIKAKPFGARAVNEAHRHVAFLSAKPTSKAAASLDPDRSPGDSFVLVGREIHLLFPNGVARTKLTNAYFDRTLGAVCTVRNWRTVLKLAELARAEP